MKLNGKSSCRPLRAALPKPKPGDRTLIALRSALNVDRAELRTRRGKRPRPLPRRVAAADKKGRKVTLRALPQLMRMLDRLEQRAGASRSRRARASALRCGGPGSTAAAETGRTAGAGLEARMGPNGEEGGVITVPLNGFVMETTFTECGNKYYYVDGCPKANGDAPTSARRRVTTTTRILKDGELISFQSTDSNWEDKLLGKVMENAELKYFDLTRKEESLIVATGGVVLRGTATRTVRVNMPGGSYDSAHSSVAMAGDTSIFKADDLAASVEAAIKEYKEAQNGGSFLHTDGWATFERQRDPYCAKAEFSPASNALTLHKGQAGQLSVYAKGSDGGRATGARWTLEGPLNATFNPSTTTGANPNIAFTVSTTPSGDRVNVTVKFTSTAGVGKDTWTEPIKPLPTINRIAGSFSGTYNVAGSIVSWTGNAVYERVSPAIYGGASGTFFIASGTYTMTASGLDGSTATACRQTGTKSFDLGPFSGSFAVTSLAPDGFEPPYSYGASAAPVGPHWMDITRVSCPPGAESMEGTASVTIYFPPALSIPVGSQHSEDGTVYQGSTSETQGLVSTTQNWNFTGTE